MGAGSDIAGSILGRAAPALLIIHDYQAEKERQETNENNLNKLKHILNTGRIPSVPNLEGDTAEASYQPTSEDKIFEVQFNPNELSLDVSREIEGRGAIGGVGQGDQTGGDNVQNTDTIVQSKAEFNVRLIFDHVVNQDAFTSDKLIPTASAAAGDLLQLTRRTYTVQTEIEGLMAALCNTYTRLVTFRWGDFVFTGVMTDVNSNYTMFSLSGRPIRGTIDLTIVLSEADDTLAAWARDYDRAFKDGGDFNKLSQTVGAVLNLPL